MPALPESPVTLAGGAGRAARSPARPRRSAPPQGRRRRGRPAVQPRPQPAAGRTAPQVTGLPLSQARLKLSSGRQTGGVAGTSGFAAEWGEGGGRYRPRRIFFLLHSGPPHRQPAALPLSSLRCWWRRVLGWQFRGCRLGSG